jgi:hypothetical protein
MRCGQTVCRVIHPHIILLSYVCLSGAYEAFTTPFKALMKSAFFDYEKAMQALLYVVAELQSPGFHKSFKVLYFAEQEYLRDWGNTLTGDTFIKMTDGPVPSNIYNMVKAAAGRDYGTQLEEATVSYAKQNLRVKDHVLFALRPPDVDFLAETERECIDHAIQLCRNLSYADIKQMSHDMAWEAAALNKPLDPLLIAKAGGADEIALDYLRESLSNAW